MLHELVGLLSCLCSSWDAPAAPFQDNEMEILLPLLRLRHPGTSPLIIHRVYSMEFILLSLALIRNQHQMVMHGIH